MKYVVIACAEDLQGMLTVQGLGSLAEVQRVVEERIVDHAKCLVRLNEIIVIRSDSVQADIMKHQFEKALAERILNVRFCST